MSMYRGYLADSTNIALAAAAATPLMYFAPTSTNDANVIKIKLTVPGISGAAPSSNADVVAYLIAVTGTVGGNTAVTPQQISGNILAANTVVSRATASSGLTGLTASGNALWVSDVPETSGASWADDTTNTGAEIALLPSTKYAIWVSALAGFGTDMDVRILVNFAE